MVHVRRSATRGSGAQLALPQTLIRLAGLLLSALMLHAPATAWATPASSRLPVLKRWSAPAVPSGALAPTLALRVLVAADGTVKDAKVLDKREGLQAAERRAIESARGFTFEPAMANGKPVEAWITLSLPMQASAPPARELVVKGSDTMGAALMPAWAEALHRAQPSISVRVESLGSSTGFAGLLDGSADLAESSRLINARELAFAERLGVQLHEIVVGYDGLSIIVHPDSPVRDLDTKTLARIFAGEVTNWREVGGPDAPIRPLGRPSYSGTHAFFKHQLQAELGAEAGFGAAVRSVESSDDLVSAVAKDPSAIAYVGLAYVSPAVKVLALRQTPKGAAVTPSASSIQQGSYPLKRPLLLYMRTDAGRDPRHLVDLALSKSGQALLAKSGFVPVPAGSGSSFATRMPAPRVSPPEMLRIYFEQGNATVSAESKLDVMQAAMAARGDHQVLVIGNADSTGKQEDNRRLAQQRAEVIAARLREHASPRTSIEVLVAATEHPLASNGTADGRHANRRVDVVVLDAPGPDTSRQTKPSANLASEPAKPRAVVAASADESRTGL